MIPSMSASERFRAVIGRKPFDRLPMVEWAGWWTETTARWLKEGLPVRPPEGAEHPDRYELCRYFGLDIWHQAGYRLWTPDMPWKKTHGAPLICDVDEYEAHRARYCLKENRPAAADWPKWIRERDEGKSVVFATVPGFFWYPRDLFGIEAHLYAFYDHPETMHKMNSDLADWILSVLDQFPAIGVPDFMTFAEDMSYNHGPMLSEAMFDEFLLPYYRRVIPRMEELGILPVIDSDGDVAAMLPWFERAGIRGVLPLERQAGVDVAALRERHPAMNFIGGYDKMVMTGGEEAMRGEFERLLPVARRGGFIISMDHQTPPGASLDAYRTYLRLFAEYARRAAE